MSEKLSGNLLEPPEPRNSHVEMVWGLLAPYIASEDPPDLSNDDQADTLTACALPQVWGEILALESSLAQAQADMEALRATIRSIERADETGDWSDYWDAVHRALAALPEHLRGESR
ncbi:MAG TPA: hypothetical protein VJA25_03995 [Dehalococcoidia bacterium]|nr:hypothetical protein [Dehalococcoidia bacterium]